MTGTLTINNGDNLGIRWTPMVALSGSIHVLAFIILIFLPGSIPQGGDVRGKVYEVDLVEMPSLSEESKGSSGTTTAVKEKGTPTALKGSQTRRISEPQEESTPISVAKKSVEKKNTTVKKTSSSRLLDSAISEIEKKVKTEDADNIEKTISDLEKKVGKAGGQDDAGGWSLNGITIRIYQMKIETRIKSNWSYPVAALAKKDLQATVTIKVSRDGSILNHRFKDRSSDTTFDQSVLKAIEKSNPLPPFPEGYRKSYDEIEINFNLKDLENS